MQVVFLVGKDPHTDVILDQLIKRGVPIGNTTRLQDYTYHPGDFPLLISGNGLYHGESYELSEKIIGQITHKVSIDNHDDFGYYRSQLGVDCQNHMRAFHQQYGIPASILGANNLFNLLSLNAPDEVEASHLLRWSFSGQNIHLTHDVDANAGSIFYVSKGWGKFPADQPQEYEIAQAYQKIMEENTFVAYDISGLDGKVMDEYAGNENAKFYNGYDVYAANILRVLENI